MELDIEDFRLGEEGNTDLESVISTPSSNETGDEVIILSDYSDDDSVSSFHPPRSYYQALHDYNWIHLPVGMYDPFDRSFPRNLSDRDWGIMATRFIYDSLRTYKGWNLILDSICDPFSDQEGIYLRTRNWFNSLEFDVQMEVWVQRNLGLRPRSKWILGPHDELLEEWATRYEMGKCRIPDVSYPGMELGYALTSGHYT
jgi:hypothetical protein